MSPLTLSALYFKIVSLNEAGALSPGKAGCQQVPRISLSLSPTALGYTHMLLLLAFSGVLGAKLRSYEGPASSLPTEPSPQPSWKKKFVWCVEVRGQHESVSSLLHHVEDGA